MVEEPRVAAGAVRRLWGRACGGGRLGERLGEQLYSSHLARVWSAVSKMRNQIDLLAAVTVLGVLEQGKCPLYNA